MATRPLSPSQLKKEKRAQNNAAFIGKDAKKNFKVHMKSVRDLSAALFKLQKALGGAGRNAVIYYPPEITGIGAPIEFSSKHLKTGKDILMKMLHAVDKYYTNAGKREPKPLLPESFRSVYMPVFLGGPGNPLYELINRGDFGPIDPRVATTPDNGTNPPLSSRWRAAKAGYVMRNFLTLAFFIYTYNNPNPKYADPATGRAYRGLADPNNGQYVTPDALWDEVFGRLPALKAIVQAQTASGKITVTKVPNTTTETTYDSLSRTYTGADTVDEDGNAVKHEKFDRTHIRTYFFQSMAALNFTSYSKMEPAIRNGLDNDTQGIKPAMLEDHALVRQTLEIWSEIYAPLRASKAKASRDKKRDETKAKKRLAEANAGIVVVAQ